MNRKPQNNRSSKIRVSGSRGKTNERRGSKKRPQTDHGLNQVEDDPKGVRLNRYIAQAGVCSRRKADELILEGRVRINGDIVKELGTRVQKDDLVDVGGRRITPQRHEYLLVNKPADVITTNSDEKGRKIVLDLIDNNKVKQKRVVSGRPIG